MDNPLIQFCFSEIPKGSRKNNFTELAPRFRLALFDPKSQTHTNSRTISRILRLRIGQTWAEDGMQKCDVIFARALSQFMLILYTIKIKWANPIEKRYPKDFYPSIFTEL